MLVFHSFCTCGCAIGCDSEKLIMESGLLFASERCWMKLEDFGCCDSRGVEALYLFDGEALLLKRVVIEDV